MPILELNLKNLRNRTETMLGDEIKMQLFYSYLVAIAFVLISIPTHASAKSKENNDQIIRSAKKAENVKEYKKSLKLYKKASRVLETRLDALLGLSRIQMAQGEFEDALNGLTEYLDSVDPFQLDVRILIAEIKNRQGDPKSALEHLVIVEKLDPSSEKLAHIKGMSLFLLAQYKESISSLTQFLALDYDSNEALSARFTVGKAHFLQGQYNESIKVLKALIDDYPSDKESLDVLGKAYLKLSQNDDARNVFQRLLRLNPNEIDTLESLADTESARDNHAEAIKHYKKCIELEPQRLEAGLKLGKLYKKTGQLIGAEQEFLRLIKSDSTYQAAISEIYELYRRQKRQDKLGKFLKEIYELSPENTFVGVRYGRILASVGQTDEAKKVLKDTLDEDAAGFDAYLVLAEIYYKNSDYGKSISVLRRARKKFDDNDLIKYNLALAYEADGESEDAIAEYTAINDKSSVYFKARINLALLFEKIGKNELSLSVLSSLPRNNEYAFAIQSKIAFIEKKVIR